VNNKNERIVQVYEHDQWVTVSPLFLEKGMSFRMFEPTGEPVKDCIGNTEFVCVKGTYANKDGVYTIEIIDNCS